MKQLKTMICGLLAVAALCGCGGSKNVAESSVKVKADTPYGKEVTLNECQMLTEESPATRAYGEASNIRLSFAKTYAEGQARAALARAISSVVTTASKENDLSFAKYSGTEDAGQNVTDQGSEAEGLVMQVAKEVVENAVVIKTNQYIQPNRQYHVFVCVEYQGDASAMAKKITEKIKQQVSDEDRLKMEYKFKKFEEDVEKEISKMKK